MTTYVAVALWIWHAWIDDDDRGTPMVYASVNVALATLETLSYVRTATLPFNRYLVRIEVPDSVWAMREELDPLPGGRPGGNRPGRASGFSST